MVRSAIVTGAARGIGLATTRLFLEQGWQVAMVDRDFVRCKLGLGAPWRSSTTFLSPSRLMR